MECAKLSSYGCTVTDDSLLPSAEKLTLQHIKLRGYSVSNSLKNYAVMAFSLAALVHVERVD
ncbi:hypothetical protein K469DRAFT_126550 [Zopfia rhizophila CBS 207.26]|uniref:Uncharacterized protein n=1 Tax=Zopfia rhizophila CBS 207.26 TaxID=1314779 RepID=A0A6A6ETS2_9PEZI|nr:hypothetical protein K469DRAFT_126550 [Zopfia rhizophila CBS 207.26]